VYAVFYCSNTAFESHSGIDIHVCSVSVYAQEGIVPNVYKIPKLGKAGGSDRTGLSPTQEEGGGGGGGGGGGD
jgi:hypothetical protein